MSGHRGHDTVSGKAERTKKQKQLGATKRKLQKRIQEKEEKLQDVRQAVQSLKRSAQAAVEDSERIFTELIRSIERRRSEVKELIRDQEKAAESRAERLLKRLEQDIAELEQLSHTEDHIQFLQSCPSLCAPPGPGDLPSITVSPHVSFEAVSQSVAELKEKLEDICKVELVKISESVKEVNAVEPWTRDDFLMHSCQLTLDPNTAHRKLRLSEGNRKVTRVEKDQPYPNHPERFGWRVQVLCSKGLSGCCYWEVEWSGNRVFIAVSYEEIIRKGRRHDSYLGHNEKSWSLRCSPSSCSFQHNAVDTEIPVPPSSRIGVYLDHGAGTLSFYNVSGTVTLLHMERPITFTQPLYPAFWVDVGSSVKLCDLG